MPPTVRSLEERIDSLADDFGGVKTRLDGFERSQESVASHLATLAGGQSATQAQIAVLTARLEALLDALKVATARLDATITRIDSPETGLAVIAARVGTNAAEVGRLADKVDGHRVDFAAFQSRTTTVLSVVRWVGATCVLALISVVSAAFAVTRSAGNLETTVHQHQQTLEEIKRDLSELRKKT